MFSIIKIRATEDEHFDVRQAAVRELARGWQADPETYGFLCDCAVNDPFEREKNWESNPRQTALESLVKYYPKIPRTRELLQDRAQNDPDEQVRKYAREALERLDRHFRKWWGKSEGESGGS